MPRRLLPAVFEDALDTSSLDNPFDSNERESSQRSISSHASSARSAIVGTGTPSCRARLIATAAHTWRRELPVLLARHPRALQLAPCSGRASWPSRLSP